jgi:hypothetical protein
MGGSAPSSQWLLVRAPLVLAAVVWHGESKCRAHRRTWNRAPRDRIRSATEGRCCLQRAGVQNSSLQPASERACQRPGLHWQLQWQVRAPDSTGNLNRGRGPGILGALRQRTPAAELPVGVGRGFKLGGFGRRGPYLGFGLRAAARRRAGRARRKKNFEINPLSVAVGSFASIAGDYRRGARAATCHRDHRPTAMLGILATVTTVQKQYCNKTGSNLPVGKGTCVFSAFQVAMPHPERLGQLPFGRAAMLH